MACFHTLLVPYDFSPRADAALAAAVELGRPLGAALHLVHVIHLPSLAYGYAPYGASTVPPTLDMLAIREGAMGSLQEVADAVEMPTKPEPHVVDGTTVAEGIREVAEEIRADLIVMGTHGRSGLAHVILGSVAERTLRHAPCAVLTVHTPDEKAA